MIGVPLLPRSILSKFQLMTGVSHRKAAKTRSTSDDHQLIHSDSEESTTSKSSRTTKRKIRQFKTLFEPRASPLDFESLFVNKHPLRGFFVLLWAGVAFKIMVIMYESWKVTGYPIGSGLLQVMQENLKEGFILDACIVCSMFLAVIYQKLITWGIVPLIFSRIIQHILQFLWFTGFAIHIYRRNFQWVFIFDRHYP